MNTTSCYTESSDVLNAVALCRALLASFTEAVWTTDLVRSVRTQAEISVDAWARGCYGLVLHVTQTIKKFEMGSRAILGDSQRAASREMPALQLEAHGRGIPCAYRNPDLRSLKLHILAMVSFVLSTVPVAAPARCTVLPRKAARSPVLRRGTPFDAGEVRITSTYECRVPCVDLCSAFAFGIAGERPGEDGQAEGGEGACSPLAPTTHMQGMQFWSAWRPRSREPAQLCCLSCWQSCESRIVLRQPGALHSAAIEISGPAYH